MERRRAGVRAYGGHRPIFRGDYSNNEKYIYEIHRCFGWPAIDNGSHNNQPKKASTKERSMEGRCDEQEACGKYDTIFVTKIEQQRKKKKKYTMALNG